MEYSFTLFKNKLEENGISLTKAIWDEIQLNHALTQHAIRHIKVTAHDKYRIFYGAWVELMKNNEGFVVLTDEEYELMYDNIVL